MFLRLDEYHRPGELATALALLRRPGVVTRPLAGGTELVGAVDDVTQAVVDLGRLGLDRLAVQEGWAHFGAMLTLQELMSTDHGLELLQTAARHTAPRTIRQAATLGGVLAGKRADGDLTVALLALQAQVTLQAAGGPADATTPTDPRTVELYEFLDRREQILPGALITQVSIPQLPTGTAVSWQRVARTPADRSIVSCAVVVAAEEVRIALGGVAPLPMRLRVIEARVREALRANQVPPADRMPGSPPAARMAAGAAAQIAAAAEAATRDAVDPPGDFRGSRDYRRHVAGVLVRRALLEVWNEGGDRR